LAELVEGVALPCRGQAHVVTDPLYPDRLDALGQTWQAWSRLGGSLSEAQWSAPSRCPGWDVACLYAHHSQFLLALSAPPPPAPEASGQPQTAVQVLRAFNAPGGAARTAGPAVADQAAREAAQHQPFELAGRFTRLGPVIIRRLRTARPDLVVPWPPAPSGVTLGEGLRIMLLEATVHLLDVQRALGQLPDLPGTAMAHTVSLLAEMAPGVELIEAATGRSAPSPFPVLR
jgi:uncharacterized protein (TIGR03083 family)